jgi:AcrR family transcriptional regulator
MAAETRTRILNAAEQLFAYGGLEGVSLRKIGAEAGVNSAALHYHFGSREALVEAVVLRRMEPIQRRRRELLDAIVSHGDEPRIHELLEVLVLPLVELVERRRRAGPAYIRLIARLFSDRKSLAYELAMRHFGEVHHELGAQLARALPDVPPAMLARRIALCIQAVLTTLSDPRPLQLAHEAGVPAADVADVARELVDFLAGGLSAPAGPAAQSSALPKRQPTDRPRLSNADPTDDADAAAR